MRPSPTSPEPSPLVLNDYARKVIRLKSRQLIGKYGFRPGDQQDLIQELTLDVLSRLRKYDPSKACLNTFVARVVDRKVSKLIRWQRQGKRDYRRPIDSLDEIIEGIDGEGATRGEMLSQDEYDLRHGRYTQPETDRLDLRVDLSLAISSLPPDLRDLAQRLRTQTLTQVAEDMGVCRGTLYAQGLSRLRAAFQDKGLKDYL